MENNLRTIFLVVTGCIFLVPAVVYTLFIGSFYTVMISMIIEYFYKWETYVTKFIDNTFGFLKEVENNSLSGWFINPTLHLLAFFYF